MIRGRFSRHRSVCEFEVSMETYHASAFASARRKGFWTSSSMFRRMGGRQSRCELCCANRKAGLYTEDCAS